jgi:hypothetical protein
MNKILNHSHKSPTLKTYLLKISIKIVLPPHLLSCCIHLSAFIRATGPADRNLLHFTLPHSTLCKHLRGLKIFWRALIAVCNRPYRCLYFIQLFIDGFNYTSETHDFKSPCFCCWLTDVVKPFYCMYKKSVGHISVYVEKHLHQRWLS